MKLWLIGLACVCLRQAAGNKDTCNHSNTAPTKAGSSHTSSSSSSWDTRGSSSAMVEKAGAGPRGEKFGGDFAQGRLKGESIGVPIT